MLGVKLSTEQSSRFLIRATVTVMGKTYEVTGVKNLTVAAGTFDVVLKHPRKQSKERVTVTPNGVTNLSFSAE